MDDPLYYGTMTGSLAAREYYFVIAETLGELGNIINMLEMINPR